MAKKMRDTPSLDQLEDSPSPGFVTGLKALAKDKNYVVDIPAQLENSYRTKKGCWKGGAVGVLGYGGGIVPRITELKDEAGNFILMIDDRRGSRSAFNAYTHIRF